MIILSVTRTFAVKGSKYSVFSILMDLASFIFLFFLCTLDDIFYYAA